MKKKLMMALSLVLVAALSIGGTVAYLTAKTDAVVNTFTVGEVGELTLNETTGTLVDGKRQHMIVPGVATAKNPKVAYDANDGDQAVYVFVEVGAGNGWAYDASSKTYTFMYDNKATLSWSVSPLWTPVTGHANVYYTTVGTGADLDATSVIASDQINVDANNVTEANISAVANAAGELSFKAYAIQQAGFNGNVADAWTAVEDVAAS